VGAWWHRWAWLYSSRGAHRVGLFRKPKPSPRGDILRGGENDATGFFTKNGLRENFTRLRACLRKGLAPLVSVAGRKPPKMGGLNRVVCVGMDLLRTSKRCFSSWGQVACDDRSLVIFKLPVRGGVATATLTVGKGRRPHGMVRRRHRRRPAIFRATGWWRPVVRNARLRTVGARVLS